MRIGRLIWMTVDEREEIIEWLLMWSIWNREALGKLDNRKLLEEFERYNRMNRG